MAKLSSTQIFGDLVVDGEIKNKATTTTEGVVKLNNTVTSTSTTEAATAAAVKTAYDKANHSHPYATSSHTHPSSQVSDATNANTANMIVKRDASGNFSAGTITASLSGNASSATKLATARTINGTNFDGSAAITTTNWGTARTITIGSTGKSVNGSANVSWSLAEIGAAAASHTHSYLPLSGGTMTGAMSSSLTTSTHLNGNKGGAIINSTASGSGYNMLAKMNSTNGVWTFGSYGQNFNFYYTANSTITAGTNTITKTVTLLNESGNTTFCGTVTAPTFSGALSGNASTATKLATARTINGTSFDGSAAITTSNWGTARTLTIGSTGKSVNGSANVSWSLTEMGAAKKTMTHDTETFYNEPVAHFKSASSSLTGTIKITLPKTWSSTMLSFDLICHDYSSYGRYIYHISGYNYSSTSSAWHNAQFSIQGNPKTTSVRFGHDGSKCCILIGTTSSTWSYPSFTITNVKAGHSSGTGWDTGWTIAAITSESGITNIVSGTNATWSNLPSASTSAKGIVQLSSATNSTSTTLAATASAVKAAYDLAAGKAASSHTHNYAGSSSAGGAATSALACTGNSATATTLQTARTINGTSFNGSANITTANWGTARTFTIGSTGKSVNGSGNVSWSLSEIGAAAASHTHSILTGINDTRTTTFNPSSSYSQFKITFQNNSTNGVNDGGSFYSLMHIPRWTDSSGGYGSQLAFTDNNNIWYRKGTGASTWGSWYKIYHSGAKPTLAEIGAAASSHTHSYLPLSGGTLTGALNFANATLNRVGDDAYLGDNNVAGCVCIKGNNGATGLTFIPYSGSITQTLRIDGSNTMTLNGNFRADAEIQSTTANAFRAVQGNYGFFIRQDGANTYFMLTNSGDPYGGWNSLRPLVISNSSGDVQTGHSFNVGNSNGNVKRTTISTGSPSGGANGDVWIKYS